MIPQTISRLLGVFSEVTSALRVHSGPQAQTSSNNMGNGQVVLPCASVVSSSPPTLAGTGVLLCKLTLSTVLLPGPLTLDHCAEPSRLACQEHSDV